MITLTQEKLKEILSYNFETGLWTWLIYKANGIHPGDKAGCIGKQGYIQIKIDGKTYKAHRLAWLYMTGDLPINFIDHIDMNRSNNKWNNLREATNSQNQANTKINKNNRTGFRGVYWFKEINKFRAQIQQNGKVYYLGCKDTPEEAYKLYCDAAKIRYEEFIRI